MSLIFEDDILSHEKENIDKRQEKQTVQTRQITNIIYVLFIL